MRIKLTQSHTVLSAFSYSSLTDIVLLLLIFFLLTSSFIATKAISVSLPKAEHAASADTKQVVVTLTRDGGIFVDGTAVDQAGLVSSLSAACPDPARAVVTLSSDRAVPFDRAVMVLDAARGLGIGRFFISTEDRDDGAL